jgi:hypothetical protein
MAFRIEDGVASVTGRKPRKAGRLHPPITRRGD